MRLGFMVSCNIDNENSFVGCALESGMTESSKFSDDDDLPHADYHRYGFVTYPQFVMSH